MPKNLRCAQMATRQHPRQYGFSSPSPPMSTASCCAAKKSGASPPTMSYLANAQVISTDWRAISTLLSFGEIIGGLFYGNHPGGIGLVSGAVDGGHRADD